MPSRLRHLLLDYHGVISDGEKLPREWRRLLDEFLMPRYGGTADAWANANRRAMARSLERTSAIDPTSYYDERRRADRVEWLREMLVHVGATPPGDPELDAIALEAIAYVVPRTRATVPHAAETLRTLRARGFQLYTASGDHSHNLDGYLRGLGVRDLFREIYGADLIGVSKTSPAYYTALVQHARIAPAEALVVDDDAWRLDWASHIGMDTLLVGGKNQGSSHRRIAEFSALPNLVL
jgi:HAD superfamily hydrolase (TIGR01509 family)